jgi:mannose-1-phosphate guanylyltransferase
LSSATSTQLWPPSRRLLPKQFLPLASGLIIIRDTALFLARLPDCGAPLFVVDEEPRFLAQGSFYWNSAMFLLSAAQFLRKSSASTTRRSSMPPCARYKAPHATSTSCA